MTQPTTSATPRDLGELTSIRFFAALYVVLFHAYDSLPALYAWDSGLIRNGYLGVDLFFILSGVILTHVNLDRVQAGTFRFRDFMIHRLARIYPLHLVMFLAFVVLYGVAGRAGLLRDAEGRNWSYAAQHLLLLHAWGTTGSPAWNGPSWSISAEFLAYLSFPLYLILVRRWRPLPGLAVAGGVFALFWLASPFFGGAMLTQRSYDFGILRIIPEFMIGAFLYMAIRQTCNRVTPDARVMRLAISANILTYLAAAHADMPDPVLILILAVLIFVLGVAAFGSQGGLMRHPALVYLGEISYSTYMVHFIFLVVAEGLASRLFSTQAFPLWYWGATIATIYLASVVSYHLIELPARRFIRARATPHPAAVSG